MKKLLLPLLICLLSSCAGYFPDKDLKKHWYGVSCGDHQCSYDTPEKVSPVMQVSNFTNDKEVATEILMHGTGGKCLIGLLSPMRFDLTTESVLAFNKEHLMADYILFAHVKGNEFYDLNNNGEYLGDVEPYDYYTASFYVKASRTNECYDVTKGKALRKQNKQK